MLLYGFAASNEIFMTKNLQYACTLSDICLCVTFFSRSRVGAIHSEIRLFVPIGIT